MPRWLGAFTFDGSGSTKDRLLSALVILLVAYLLSLAGVYLPWGRFIGVTWGLCIVGLSALEVARLLARDIHTTRYHPLRGAVLLVIFLAPGLAATVAAIEWIASSTVNLSLPYVASAVSAIALTVTHVWKGRSELTVASWLGERMSPIFILVVMCGTTLIFVAAHERGVQLLWWLIGTVAVNDAAAYFFGRQFGRHKMAPALSPNKSVEGGIAGLLFGAPFGAFLWGVLVQIPLEVSWLLCLSFLVVVCAQAADLSKSYFKRMCGVKDTGALFPGHGGMLDRFDGALGAAPVVLLWLYVFYWQ